MKQLTLVAAGAIASRVSGLSIATSMCTDAEKKDFFASGRTASGHPPLVRTHGRTDKCNLSIMIIVEFDVPKYMVRI